jgi:hypothetical protein
MQVISNRNWKRSDFYLVPGLFFLLFALTLHASGQTTPPPPEGMSRQIPTGTVLQIRLQQTVSSFGSKRDAPVSAIVIAPVESEHQIVLPLNSELRGILIEVRRVGMGVARESAMLQIDLDSIKLPDGQTLPIKGHIIAVDEWAHCGRLPVRLQASARGRRNLPVRASVRKPVSNIRSPHAFSFARIFVKRCPSSPTTGPSRIQRYAAFSNRSRSCLQPASAVVQVWTVTPTAFHNRHRNFLLKFHKSPTAQRADSHRKLSATC